MRFLNFFSLMIVTIFVTKISFGGDALLIQSTTSTKNSGFFDYILPIIHKETDLTANVVAVGTGAAIKNAEKCNGDILLVHAKARESLFLKAGYGLERKDLMYNDFILVGPKSDPAKIYKSKNITAALKRIAAGKLKFASRGDDSGTNIKELELWKLSQINPQEFSGEWYLEMGAGMGATLNAGIELNAYILTDRATWISFKNKRDFRILFEGDPNLFNQYGIIAINPSNCPNTKIYKANKFIEWLTSNRGQKEIKNYKIDGQQLFFPNAK